MQLATKICDITLKRQPTKYCIHDCTFVGKRKPSMLCDVAAQKLAAHIWCIKGLQSKEVRQSFPIFVTANIITSLDNSASIPYSFNLYICMISYKGTRGKSFLKERGDWSQGKDRLMNRSGRLLRYWGCWQPNCATPVLWVECSIPCVESSLILCDVACSMNPIIEKSWFY